jgi:ribosomal protein L40E
LLLDYNFYYWIVPYAIWIIYLQQSKRVRVTYERCVIQDSAPNDQNLQIQTPVTPTQVKQSALGTQLNNHSNAVISANFTNATQQALTIPTNTQVTAIPSSDTDSSPSEEFWAAAFEEFENSARRPGLWARTFAEANGNEAVAKAAYLTLRVAEMQSAEIKRVQDLKAAEAERNYQLLPKGSCSNEYCKAIIPLASKNCPKCNAAFGTRYGWSINPIEQSMAMTEEEINHSKQLKCICSYCKKALLSPTATSCHKCNTTFTASSASFRLIPIDLQIQEEVLSKAIQLKKSFTEFEVDMLSKK